MAFSDINSVITDLANPGGCTLIALGVAPIINGRPGLPVATLTSVTDVVHHPSGAGKANVDAQTHQSTDEKLDVYLRQQILPAVIESAEPWWVVIGTKRYRVDAVEDWTVGGFWVAKTTRVRDDQNVGQVAFRAITNAQAAAVAATRGATVLAGSKGFSPSRAFRFVLANAADVVGVVYPQAIAQPTDAVVYRAVDPSGESVAVTPSSSATFVDSAVTYVVAVLPKVLSPDGSLRYEVV